MSATPTISSAFPREPAPRPFARRDLGLAALVCLLCLLIYNANGRLIATGDSYGARYLPFGIWRYHTLILDPIASIAAQGRKAGVPPGHKHPPDEWRFKAYWMVWTPDGHLLSLYSVAIPVLLTPLYAPAVYYLNARGWDEWRLDQVARIMEKLCASLIAATSAALVYLLLRRSTKIRLALLLTFAYAFGTTTWMIGSQALWQHGLNELLIAGMLLAVTGRCTTRAVVLAGLFCGLVVWNRSADAVLAAAIALYGLKWAGRKALLLVASALVPVALLLAYNIGIAGNWAGGYGLVSGAERKAFLSFNPLTGVLGLLFSPARGLFVYSPFLLFIPLYARQIWRDRTTRFLNLAMGAAILLQVAVYAKTDWRQGGCWGPRWLTSMLPMLVWMLPPVFRGLRRGGRFAFTVACVAGVAVEAIGAFWYTGASNPAILAFNHLNPADMHGAWDPRNTPFVVELRHAAAPADLTTVVRGSLDIARTTDGAPLSSASGKTLDLEGWALANNQTPCEVSIMLDGQVVGATRDFFVRPDVNSALGLSVATGWRLTLPARRIDPGDHLIAVFAQAVEGGRSYLVVDREFTVAEAPAPALPSSATTAAASLNLSEQARQAAASLAAHQQTPGYWLTAVTKETTFRNPHPEMDIFVNAILADLLSPIAKEVQLEENVRRLRSFLTAQIEADGLVRYHGLPNSPIIGKLGCAITPDSDDTALVWRIAPAPDRERLSRALATLDQYRTPERLYRTWLAPRDRYQCLDPGADPNPPDVGIQMHIFMLLAKADPPAARALCVALNEQITRDDIWVYYRKAPLVPFLRQIELVHEGCTIRLPSTTLSRAAGGQQPWIEAARLLKRFDSSGGDASFHAGARDLLERLSRDDFALLKGAPPLLYHNDLTATVPAFYWSEDVGYALWLRLYSENEKAGSSTSIR